MAKTNEQKYLGDIFSDDGKNKLNLEARRARGFGIVSDILSIIKEVPFGSHKIQAGLRMRNSMLINGILTNSEVWYGISDDDIKQLEQVDEYLLRELLKAHSKTPIEALYQETGSIPLRFIIKNRRLNYLYHILSRDKNELISKVLLSQEQNPIKKRFYVNSESRLKGIEH